MNALRRQPRQMMNKPKEPNRIRGDLRELAGEPLLVVASSGKRWVLENFKNEENNLDYTCKTSEVAAERMAGCIETDECVAACSLDRNSVGISSDAFLVPEFTSSLCSPACYYNCPNSITLNFDLAASEGVYLPTHCEKHRSNRRHEMVELLSSGGGAASFPVADASAPAPDSF
ncbi:hypothetical protein BUALT_Bualt11G0125400 [Buddleja alternifolia]|uniref:Uncharacterized protein n=1 Tax=Buddleja alternifolia TaxID=168488 RepID=A0AAV6WZB2_9LAMI|nr:hypothetical protein BUALT_Bualt11G0125400 [Buddleja alternifolia]